jgi:hypothetical protein
VSATLSRWLLPLACLFWLALMAAALLGPALVCAADPGDALTRNTVRVALAYYGIAAALMLVLRGPDWAAGSWHGRLARGCWTLAWAAYLVHVAMAFHHVDHWSHAHAVARTHERSGFGEGIYVSHLFTLLWTADVAWWWLRPAGYAGRPAWQHRGLQAFLAFVAFNATVVFEQGWIRWAGLALFAGLAAVWLGRRRLIPVPPDAPGRV